MTSNKDVATEGTEYSIPLLSKRTGKAFNCDIYLGNVYPGTPRTVMVEIQGGEAKGYSSLQALADDWEIIQPVKIEL